MPKLRNGNNGVRTRALSIASPAFYQLSYRALCYSWRGRRTDIITYIINNITIKGNYEPTLLLQIINVYL